VVGCGGWPWLAGSFSITARRRPRGVGDWKRGRAMRRQPALGRRIPRTRHSASLPALRGVSGW